MAQMTDSPDMTAIRAAALQIQRATEAEGDLRATVALIPTLPVPTALPISFPVEAIQSRDLALSLSTRDRTPRRGRTESEGRPSRASEPSSAFALRDKPNEDQMVAYGPARNSGWGIQGESKEQLAKNNADLLQEIADMRGSQNLWVERAEQVFALQKERFEQVAEKTPALLSHAF